MYKAHTNLFMQGTVRVTTRAHISTDIAIVTA